MVYCILRESRLVEGEVIGVRTFGTEQGSFVETSDLGL